MRLIGGTQDLPNSTRLLYRPSQTRRMILVPILLGSSYDATAGTFSPPHLICVDMCQILEYSHSIDTG